MPGQPSFANPFAGLRDYLRGGGNLLNEDPTAGYAAFTEGVQGPINLTRWLENQYNRLYGRYKAQAAFDPMLDWTDYLGKQDIGKMYGNEAPAYRGEQPGRFAPRARYSNF